MSLETTYLAEKKVDAPQIQEWVDTFNRQGFLFLENVLPPNWCRALREDLEYGLRENPNGLNSDGEKMALCHRMFEFSNANLRLFDMEPIISFAEGLVAENCHVIHNNSFVTRTGGEFRWHQDDLPHYIVTEGEPPTNVHLPVMWFTCNYYLTDVPERDSRLRWSHHGGVIDPDSRPGTDRRP